MFFSLSYILTDIVTVLLLHHPVEAGFCPALILTEKKKKKSLDRLFIPVFLSSFFHPVYESCFTSVHPTHESGLTSARSIFSPCLPHLY